EKSPTGILFVWHQATMLAPKSPVKPRDVRSWSVTTRVVSASNRFSKALRGSSSSFEGTQVRISTCSAGRRALRPPANSLRAVSSSSIKRMDLMSRLHQGQLHPDAGNEPWWWVGYFDTTAEALGTALYEGES